MGQAVLQALRCACSTSFHATWLGVSPASQSCVYVVRASTIAGSDLSAMVRACASVPGVSSVSYEIDCGDRAVRLEVGTAPGGWVTRAWCIEACLAALALARLGGAV